MNAPGLTHSKRAGGKQAVDSTNSKRVVRKGERAVDSTNSKRAVRKGASGRWIQLAIPLNERAPATTLNSFQARCNVCSARARSLSGVASESIARLPPSRLHISSELIVTSLCESIIITACPFPTARFEWVHDSQFMAYDSPFTIHYSRKKARRLRRASC